MNKIALPGGLFVFFWLLFQLAFSSGKHYQHKAAHENYVASVEKRVALDLPKLKLSNPRFRTVAHEASVLEYLGQLNATLDKANNPVRVLSIQEVGFDADAEQRLIPRVLQTADQHINLQLTVKPVHWWHSLSPIPPLLALMMLFASRGVVQRAVNAPAPQASLPAAAPQAKLVINLHNKTIGNGIDEVEVKMSNKPFCFYAALVDYCLEQEAPYLNHNKNVPEDLIHIATKYFYRLIELGHTKRKRPDFATNLDKTLSEIRTALDEVFHDHSLAKEHYYPPKAQGEGSRSKMHNYALELISREEVEFIGK